MPTAVTPLQAPWQSLVEKTFPCGRMFTASVEGPTQRAVSSTLTLWLIVAPLIRSALVISGLGAATGGVPVRVSGTVNELLNGPIAKPQRLPLVAMMTASSGISGIGPT